MTNYSLKTGEVVQVEDITSILFMSDEEYFQWEASVLGTQQHSAAAAPLGESNARDWTDLINEED